VIESQTEKILLSDFYFVEFMSLLLLGSCCSRLNSFSCCCMLDFVVALHRGNCYLCILTNSKFSDPQSCLLTSKTLSLPSQSSHL
jgi:hypothetical protein